MTQSNTFCLYCERDSNQTPLIALEFQGHDLWICAQHLPVLIHSPAKLAHKIPELAQLSPAEEHHHHD
jgi:hypothetical protein